MYMFWSPRGRGYKVLHGTGAWERGFLGARTAKVIGGAWEPSYPCFISACSGKRAARTYRTGWEDLEQNMGTWGPYLHTVNQGTQKSEGKQVAVHWQ